MIAGFTRTTQTVLAFYPVARLNAGVVFGAIRPVEGIAQERARIAEFVAAQTADVSGPVLYGIEAGHGTENLTLPLGLSAKIESSRRRLVITGPAVS